MQSVSWQREGEEDGADQVMLSHLVPVIALHLPRLRVQGSGFRVQGSGFRVQGSGIRVWGSGCGVQGLEMRV